MSLKLNTQPAPHIRHHETTRVLMGDAVLALLIVYAMAYFYYGMRAVALGAWSVGICVAADVLCVLIGRNRPHLRDLSAVVTGLILPLMMPATISYPVVAAAAVFAIVVAKHPFGGVGHNIFNPAAAGISFAIICFGEAMFTYPAAQQKLPVSLDGLEPVAGLSAAYSLELGARPSYELVDMALGNFAGPMGATNILVLLACLLYLIFRNTVRWDLPLAFFASVALFAFLFPRIAVDAVGAQMVLARLESVALEMMSGILLFSGVFLLGDPVTTPKRTVSRVAFGVASGVMVMLFRMLGRLEEGVAFAILLMNSMVWIFDMLGERLYSKIRRRRIEAVNSKKIPKKA